MWTWDTRVSLPDSPSIARRTTRGYYAFARIRDSTATAAAFFMSEIILLVEESHEGGYTARALGASIFTEANDWQELQANVRDAVSCHFESGEAPGLIRLHFLYDEVSTSTLPNARSHAASLEKTSAWFSTLPLRPGSAAASVSIGGITASKTCLASSRSAILAAPFGADPASRNNSPTSSVLRPRDPGFDPSPLRSTSRSRFRSNPGIS